MSRISKLLERSPALARVAPFALFLALTSCQELPGEASRYWFYLAKTVVGVWLIWLMRPLVTEMRWALSWAAVAVGVAVFAVWVGCNDLNAKAIVGVEAALHHLAVWVGFSDFYPKFWKAGAQWNPHACFGLNSGLAWLFILVRVAGSSLIVPPLEEVFYRSFLYRYIAKPDFAAVPLGTFAWLPFVVTSGIFGLVHYQWLAGILCGLAFQGLVCWKKRLGDAMTAHAITNFLLGLWVAGMGDWKFW
jgi:hypothetical protein